MPNTQSLWTKILDKGMITIPKVFRDELGFRKGDIAMVKMIGNRLVIESHSVAGYEVYSDETIERTLKVEDSIKSDKNSLLKLAGIGKGPKDLSKNHDKYWE